MANSQLYTNEAAARKATLLIAGLANSKLRLCKTGISVTRFTTKAQLVAAEATFSNYTAGGYTLAAWTGPGANPDGGATMTSPLVNPTWVEPEEDDPVGNEIVAWWVEDATGNVRIVGRYDPPIPMSETGNTFPWISQIVEAKNPASENVEA
jgi:hypothetical protein